MIDQVKAALAALREGDGDGAVEILESVLGELQEQPGEAPDFETDPEGFLAYHRAAAQRNAPRRPW